jgi:endonuclease III
VPKKAKAAAKTAKPSPPTATPAKLIPRPKTARDRARRVAKIVEILDAMYPRPAVPLQHRNCWELLVATILSAQCTDKTVNETTPGLFAKYPTMQDFASANQAELGAAIRSTGFFNNKAKSLIGAAKKLLADFGGEVPKTMADMLTIPGAARKTANVVLGGCYQIHEGIVVDTHVQRNAQRLDLTKNTNPVKIEQDLMKIIPREKWFDFPLQLIYHGRSLCPARNPKCAECRLDSLCYAKDKTV